MKQLVLAACLGALTLTTGAALAQEPAKKPLPPPRPKRARQKPPQPPRARGAVGRKVAMRTGRHLWITGNMLRDEVLTVHWEGRTTACRANPP
jgi:hypothetical protein